MNSPRPVLRHRLLTGAAPLAALVMACGAQAQTAPAPTAGDTAAQANTVGEVVVTAQFRQQNLQKTPLAITAVNAQMLENRNQTKLSDVTAQAPNVTLTANGAQNGSSMVAFIRGVGQTDFNLALEPGVGIYVDDVYYPTLTGSLLDLLDLDRVEILRGPQGTLAGKNSIGGAIKLYSQKPNGNDGGYVEATYGSLNKINARGAGDFTLVADKLFARISASTENHDGYVTRYDYACMHPGSNLKSMEVGDGCTLGHDGDQHVSNGRLAVRWLATDRLEINASGSITQDNSGVPANTLLKVNTAPGASLGGAVYTPGVNGAPVFFGPQFLPSNPYSSYATYHSNACSLIFGCDPYAPVSVPAINHLTETNADVTIDYKLADNLSLKSITGYQYYSNQFAEQTDGSPIGVEILLQKQTHHSVSQEVRLSGNWDKLLDYTVGGFYIDQNGGLNARVGLPWVGFDFEHGPDSTPATTKAAFADATWHIIPKLDLSGGVRYSDETKDYTYYRHNADGTPITNPLGYNGVLGPQAGPPALPALSGTTAHFTGSRVDYRVALQYQFTPDIMGYVDTATGYKGGGVDPRPFVLTQAVSFQPETLTAYEGGLKMYLWDHKARLNLAGFYNDYDSIQLTLSSCPAQSGGNAAIPCALPANVGNAHVAGFEAETELHPLSGLEVDGSLSYLNFKYTSIANAAATGITLGMTTPYTPEWKWSLGVQYLIDMGGWGSLTPRVDVNYQSSEFTNPINDPAWNQIAGYTVANARLTYRAPKGGWSAWLEVSNLTNQLYYLTLFDQHSSAGYVNGQPAMPREWSMTIKKTF
jgi:iron complex outermembrane receptor protein